MKTVPEAVDELEDVAASRRGDEAAYARLVLRHQAAVAAQMWRFTRDPGIHEELVQEVFVQAYLSLNSYRGDAPWLHWLRRVATYTGYQFWKRQQRERQRTASLESLASIAVAQPETLEPTEAAEVLFGLFEQLAPAERLVLTLQYFEECDTKEIAERTGWSRSLAKVRAFRARKKLRVMLEDAGYGKK